MFDRPTHVHVAPTPVQVDVHVPKQDPIEAVKVYAEFVEKARQEVRAAVVNELGCANEFKVARLDVEGNFETNTIGAVVAFSLNGTQHAYRLDNLIPDDIERKAWTTIADHITHQLMDKLLKHVRRMQVGKAP
jgi:hypothetical protein